MGASPPSGSLFGPSGADDLAGYEPFIQQKNNHSVRGKKYVEGFYYPSDFL
jgi:hypothetical protein